MQQGMQGELGFFSPGRFSCDDSGGKTPLPPRVIGPTLKGFRGSSAHHICVEIFQGGRPNLTQVLQCVLIPKAKTGTAQVTLVTYV